MSRDQLENNCLSVQISDEGAELMSIIRKSDGREYLWCGDAVYWGRRAPVLFPFVGSLQKKQYLWNGKSYPMGQHGFARDQKFDRAAQGENFVRYRLCSNEETWKRYPFSFQLDILYTLKDNAITVTWEITNPADEPLYYSIGAHPAFYAPMKEGYLGFDKGGIRYRLIGPGGLMEETQYDLEMEGCYAKLYPELFDRDALIIEGDQAHRVWIADRNRRPIVTLAFDAPLFGIWSPAGKNAPFLCIEPWYGRCDRIDFAGSLEEREWGQTLAPKASRRISYEIIIGIEEGNA